MVSYAVHECNQNECNQKSQTYKKCRSKAASELKRA